MFTSESQNSAPFLKLALVFCIATSGFVSSPTWASGADCVDQEVEIKQSWSAYFKSHFIKSINQFIKIYNRKTDHRGKVVTSKDGRWELTFGKKLGMGFWGSVYEVSSVKRLDYKSAEAVQTAFPEISRHPERFVLKIPNKAPWPLGSRANRVILEEFFQSSGIEGALRKIGQAQIEGGNVLQLINEGTPILIKRKYSSGLTVENGGLTRQNIKDYIDHIYRDVFKPAKTLFEETGVIIDLRAENIFFEPGSTQAKMYETTIAKPATMGLVKGSFEQYVQYLKSTIDIHAKELNK